MRQKPCPRWAPSADGLSSLQELASEARSPHAWSLFSFPFIIITYKTTAINSPDSLAQPPGSSSDWFIYSQRKYDFQFPPGFRCKRLNFEFIPANTQSGNAS